MCIQFLTLAEFLCAFFCKEKVKLFCIFCIYQFSNLLTSQSSLKHLPHSLIRTHTLMADAAMDSENQIASYPTDHSAFHTATEQTAGAILGSVSCSRRRWHVARTTGQLIFLLVNPTFWSTRIKSVLYFVVSRPCVSITWLQLIESILWQIM